MAGIKIVPSFANNFIDSETLTRLKHSVAPHVDSFNYFLDRGLADCVAEIHPMEFAIEDLHISVNYSSVSVAFPCRKDDILNSTVTPAECRESGSSYAGAISANVEVRINSKQHDICCRLGELPIMVKSDRCHLRNLDHKGLVAMREEANEVGGYFIINGIERVIRLLQVPRRNYATAIERSSFKNRGPLYSDKGVSMRCCRKDQTSVTITVHYLSNGGATLKFVLRKQEFLLPVILVVKSLINISDKEIFDRIVAGNNDNTFLTTRLELLLRDFKNYQLTDIVQCRAYLGSLFRNFLPIPESTSNEDAGRLLIQMYLFVHTDNFSEKLDCLIFMLQKLFAFAEGKCLADNADSLMNHEILLPGHLLTSYFKEKLEESLISVKQSILKDYRNNPGKFLSELSQSAHFQKHFERSTLGIGGKIGTFLSTGNIVSSTGLDLMQVSGYTIVADRLNLFRYMSHFQSVHRGQFFTTMKTTTVRKLLPESWGFLCPVHTPDGSPCGLLNHLAKDAIIVAFPTSIRPCSTASGDIQSPVGWSREVLCSRSHFVSILSSMGMFTSVKSEMGPEITPVMMDGIVVGGIKSSEAFSVVRHLRRMKTSSDKKYCVDPTVEIAYIPVGRCAGAFAGIFIFTQPGRLLRPVLQVDTDRVEWIGPMEQVFMSIACLPTDLRQDHTHIELEAGVMLSHIASLTPFSDYNQSPRNMYQCQMGKQTMGTPAHALKFRADNKLYRIQNVHAPIVQTRVHREYSMDEYPQGVNAVVAVISYTGYDMEDAMIINKASYERGFGHGSVYKTHVYDLDEEEKHSIGSKSTLRFCNVRTPPLNDSTGTSMVGEKFCEELDVDGLPFEGVFVRFGDPLLSIVDVETGAQRFINHKDHEPAFVQTVRVIGMGGNGASKSRKFSLRKVSITLRYRRNPVIGDKFSSRHGQKGTLSVLWPQENMPFTETGLSPDVLINPHAFPSRMTIGSYFLFLKKKLIVFEGMLIESMAGKAGAVHGVFQDSSPFQFHEENRVIDHIGAQLRLDGLLILFFSLL